MNNETKSRKNDYSATIKSQIMCMTTRPRRPSSGFRSLGLEQQPEALNTRKTMYRLSGGHFYSSNEQQMRHAKRTEAGIYSCTSFQVMAHREREEEVCLGGEVEDYRTGTVDPSAASCDRSALSSTQKLTLTPGGQNEMYICICVCPDLLFPVEDANNHKDEDTHSDKSNGRQQHAVARSQVQLSTPARERERERQREEKEKESVNKNEELPYAVFCFITVVPDR